MDSDIVANIELLERIYNEFREESSLFGQVGVFWPTGLTPQLEVDLEAYGASSMVCESWTFPDEVTHATHVTTSARTSALR